MYVCNPINLRDAANFVPEVVVEDASWWCAGVGSLPPVSRSKTPILNVPVVD